MTQTYVQLVSTQPEPEVQLCDALADVANARILFIVEEGRLPVDGEAAVAGELCDWLRRNGGQVSVLSIPARAEVVRSQGVGASADQPHELAEAAGEEASKPRSWLGGAHRIVAKLLEARKICGRRRGKDAALADYVVTICPSVWTAAVANVLRTGGCRSLSVVHGIRSTSRRRLGRSAGNLLHSGSRALEAWTLNQLDVVVTLSQPMAAELRELGVRRPVVVLPAPIDVGGIKPLSEANSAARVLLYSGALGRNAGADQVLGLAAVLLRRGVDAKIVILGQGVDRARLERQALESNLTNVVFDGLGPAGGTAEALAAAAIHIVPGPATTATVPNEVYRIMAAATPFVATANPMTPLWRVARQSGAGLCVEPYAVEALADAVVELIDNPIRRRRMGTSGRKFVEKHADRSVVCAAMWRALHG